MQNDVWILDQDEDNRELALVFLVRSGLNAVAFPSVDCLLEIASGKAAPAALVVDAVSAEGREHDVAVAIPSRLVVLTTWPRQRLPWSRVGAERFLLKPYDCDSLLELVTGPTPRSKGLAGARARARCRPAA